MNAAEIVAAVSAACDRRGVAPGPDPVRLRMLALAAEARRVGQDPVRKVEDALALMFDPFVGPQNPTPGAAVPPTIHVPGLRWPGPERQKED
jgi:hypothetical protein